MNNSEADHVALAVTVRRRLRAWGGAVVPGLLVLVLAPAIAWAGCDATDNDIAEANRVIQRLKEFEIRLNTELRQQTAQLSGYIAQGSRAVVEGLSADAKVRAQTAREAAEVGSAIEHVPSLTGCRTVTGLAGLGAARHVSGQVMDRTLATETGRLAGSEAAIGYPAGQDASVRARRVQQHYASGPLAGADLLTSNLLSKDRLAGAAETGAALDLLRNLVRPVALPPHPAADTPGERRRLMERRSRDSKAALAAAWMTRAIASRVPSVELGEWAAAVAPGSVAAGTALSERELLRILALDRPGNPTYLASLSELSDAELLREIIRLQVIELRLAMERLTLAEHHGAIDAALLAHIVDGDGGSPLADVN